MKHLDPIDTVHIDGARLSAYGEGDLLLDERPALEAHLAACPTCADSLVALRTLATGLARLADVEPSSRLWARIEAAQAGATSAHAKAHSAPWRWLWPLGGLVAATAIAWLLLWPRAQTEPPDALTPAPLAVLPSVPRTKRAANAREAVARAEAAYRQAIEGLRGAVETEGRARPQALAPKAQAAVTRSLRDIDVAIERCRAALQTAPDDTRAQEALLAAYQHKSDLLNELLQEAM